MASRSTIRASRLTPIAVFAVVALGLLAAAVLLHRFMRQGARERAAAELDSMASLKVAVVGSWRTEHLGHAAYAASYPSVARLALEAGRGRLDPVLRSHVREVLEHLAEREGYLRIALLAPDGRALAAWSKVAGDERPFRPGLVRAALEATSGSAAELASPPGRARPLLEVAVAIRPAGGPPCALALEADIAELYDQVIQQWPAPTKSGTTGMVRRDGNDAVLLANGGGLPGARESVRVPLSARDVPAVKAALGFTGIAEGLDLFERPVLAAIRPIPGTDWKLVAKMDLSEIEAPILGPFSIIASLVAALLVAGGVMLALWWRGEATRERMEAELRESRDLLQLALAGIHSVWDWDLLAGRLSLEPGWAGSLGLPSAVLEGDAASILSRLAHPGDLPEVRSRVEAHARGDAPSLEVEFRSADPEGARWVLMRGQGSRRDGAGRAARMTGVVSDVTERRRMQAHLERSERLAGLGTLAAGVAHEINNPLAYVLANLDHLLSHFAAPGTSPDLAEALAEARSGAERVREVVRGLRAFSRPGGSRRGPVEVGPEIEAALRLAGNEIRHRAQLEVSIGPLPPVAAIDHELGQVFLNLLLNAAQAIPEGRARENTIRVEAATDPMGWARIEVRDSGVGMAPEVQKRIFEPFFTTKRGTGTGLGLAIAHGIVASAGGRIEVESRLGAGTTVRVSLPPAPPEAATAPRPPPSARERQRILIVDDDPRVARAIGRLLGRDQDLVTVEAASEALSRIEAGGQFDAVICDLEMPQMTGMELHERIAARDPGLGRRMIFVTGGAFTERASDFLRRIPNPCLEKPFDAAQLREALERIAGEPGPVS
jgi:signal transduction histidine kinase/CheY-like chemotaxis protein